MAQLDLFATAPASGDLFASSPAPTSAGGPKAFAPIIDCAAMLDGPEVVARAREINFAGAYGTILVAIRPLDGQASEFIDVAECKVPGLRADRMRLLALASLIAAMDGRETISRVAVAEALSYRPQWTGR